MISSWLNCTLTYLNMKCIAIDDEPLALELIKDFASKSNYLEICATFTDALKAGDYLKSNPVDLIFLDIQMPNITGIEFLHTLTNPPLVIFTTAYNQYALEGYELNAIDYLLKPFSFERFNKAVHKAQEYFELKQVKEGKSELSVKNDFVLVKSDYQIVKVLLNEILYIESMADYIRIISESRKITVLATLKKMLEMLPPKKFLRTHRSYIINLEKIDSFNKKNIHIGKYTIPLGETYREGFENIFRDKIIEG